MVKQGGTSMPDAPTSRAWIAVLVMVAPLATYLVHRLSDGQECGWDYGAVGGACRAVILHAVLGGVGTGILAAVASHAIATERTTRALGFAVGAIAAFVLARQSAMEFQDYRHAGMKRLDSAQCRFATKTLPACAQQVLGTSPDVGSEASSSCWVRERELVVIERCMALTDCQQVIDCVTARPELEAPLP